MRITNSMMVASTKININGNKSGVDRLNRQLANQKKIVKPSDDPIVAIRSLRLRSSLSAIDQYYERNIPDTESWMDVTETALVNIKDIISKCYEQVVYGATDELNNENRLTIQKELKALQEQVYTEGNADYAGRTVFTGYKTNHKLTFTDSEDAAKSNYAITEHLSYLDVESNKYYVNQIKNTTEQYLLDDGNDVALPKEYDIKRLRTSYDNLQENGSLVTFKYQTKVETGETGQTKDVDIAFGIGKSADGKPMISWGGYELTPVKISDDSGDGYTVSTNPAIDTIKDSPVKIEIINDACVIREVTGWDEETNTPIGGAPVGSISIDNDGNFKLTTVNGSVNVEKTDDEGNTTEEEVFNDGKTFTFNAGDHAAAKAKYDSLIVDDACELFLDVENGELLLSPDVSDTLESVRANIEISYNKTGFDVGEVRPENFFDCVNNTDADHPVTYQNYDENDNWIVEGIYYNIANKQPMQINTEARDVFDANIYRDMDELVDIVNMAIESQSAVDSIKQKLDSGLYAEDSNEYKKLKSWLDAANKQLDYSVQNMHDRFSSSITTFQGYLDKVTLAVTDAGSRGERVALTKSRMSVQQTTFEELQSVNEDAELSELMIDYSAAYVAYQAALQAAGKIGKMTLLDYI